MHGAKLSPTAQLVHVWSGREIRVPNNVVARSTHAQNSQHTPPNQVSRSTSNQIGPGPKVRRWKWTG